MCVYCYHVIITFCYKVRKIVKLVIVQAFNFFFFFLRRIQAFNWLNRHVVYYFMFK